MTTLLLQHGAVGNSASDREETPLHWAAAYGHDRVCDALLQYGALVNSVDDYNRAPLHMAARMGYERTCVLLLRRGANIRMVDDERQTPLTATLYNKYSNHYRCAASMVFEWVRHQPGGTTLTGHQLVEACQAEVNISHLSHQYRQRMMEWVGMLESAKIIYRMLPACPLPFQEMVVAWLKTVSAQWEREVDGARVRVSAWVGELPVELVERVVASIASKYMTSMKIDDDCDYSTRLYD